MKVEQIEVTIGPDGKVRLETSGFAGDECLDAVKDLETLLGAKDPERELKAEYYDRPEGKTAEKVRVRR